MQKLKEDLEIAMSMTGMGFTSASTILAEIGNYKDFETAEQLASWCGLTPKVSQSADKLVTGNITKQGSKHVRRMLGFFLNSGCFYERSRCYDGIS